MLTYFGVRDGGGKVHRETWSLQRGCGGCGTLPLEHLWVLMHGPAPHQKRGVELHAEVCVGV